MKVGQPRVKEEEDSVSLQVCEQVTGVFNVNALSEKTKLLM